MANERITHYWIWWPESQGTYSSGRTGEVKKKTLRGAERVAARMSKYSMTGREGIAEITDSNYHLVSKWRGGEKESSTHFIQNRGIPSRWTPVSITRKGRQIQIRTSGR